MVEVLTSNGYRVDHEKLSKKMAKECQLSERQAEAFVLRKVGDYSVEKTAEFMEVSEGTVSSYSERYRKKLSDSEFLVNLFLQYDVKRLETLEITSS